MSIYETKNRGKSHNNYPPTHTPREGEGDYLTYLAPKDTYSWMRNRPMGPLNTKNSYCLRK